MCHRIRVTTLTSSLRSSRRCPEPPRFQQSTRRLRSDTGSTPSPRPAPGKTHLCPFSVSPSRLEIRFCDRGSAGVPTVLTPRVCPFCPVALPALRQNNCCSFSRRHSGGCPRCTPCSCRLWPLLFPLLIFLSSPEDVFVGLRERNISQAHPSPCALRTPQPGIEPLTWVCARTEYPTCNLLVTG